LSYSGPEKVKIDLIKQAILAMNKEVIIDLLKKATLIGFFAGFMAFMCVSIQSDFEMSL